MDRRAFLQALTAGVAVAAAKTEAKEDPSPILGETSPSAQMLRTASAAGPRLPIAPPLPLRFGLEEVAELNAALQRNKLWYFQDGFVNRAVERLRREFNGAYIATTSSGTASLHVAVAAAQVEPGTEVITSPITDAGTVAAIIYQNAIPVFADVDPRTSNITADTIRAVITGRTRAVLVVHLMGSPADITPIVQLCQEKKLTLIEDCAQGLGATYDGRPVGTFGDFGCYSLNDQKHITCGEGGFVVTNSEDRYYRCHNYADKYYDRHKRGTFLTGTALNYRMSEIDGAMTLAQIERLASVVARRRHAGDRLTRALTGIRGIIPPAMPPKAVSSYFFYMFRIDEGVLKITREEFGKRLRAEGLEVRGGYLPWPLYKAPAFVKKAFFPGGIWPAEVVSSRKYDYAAIRLSNAELALNSTVSFSFHEGFTDTAVNTVAAVIRQVAESA